MRLDILGGGGGLKVEHAQEGGIVLRQYRGGTDDADERHDGHPQRADDAPHAAHLRACDGLRHHAASAGSQRAGSRATAPWRAAIAAPSGDDMKAATVAAAGAGVAPSVT